jgi:hypothetical protein
VLVELDARIGVLDSDDGSETVRRFDDARPDIETLHVNSSGSAQPSHTDGLATAT